MRAEYLSELLRAHRKHRAKEQLEQILIDTLNSGEPVEVTPAMVEAVRRRLRARAAQRQPTKR